MADRIALITGASRGLGRSMALHLARRGMHIIGTYRTAVDEVADVAKEIEACGVKAVMLPFDAETHDLESFVRKIREILLSEFGTSKLDHLINNAGLGNYAGFADTTAEQIDQLYHVHLRTPYLLTHALLPSIADGGSVLFVSSGLTRITLPGYATYASMKGAVEILTRYAARELGERKIRVNCIAPGAVETDFGGGVVRDNSDLNSFIASATALGRVGLPDDIGGAVAALISDDMSWMTGERIEVSGGQSL